MLDEQLHKIKNSILYFILIGIIISYLIVSFSTELELVKSNINSIEVMRYNLFTLFISIQIFVFFIKLFVNRKFKILKFENLIITLLFVLQILILNSTFINGEIENFGLAFIVAIAVIELVKIFVILNYGITNVLDNFYTKKKINFLNNNFIGVRND